MTDTPPPSTRTALWAGLALVVFPIGAAVIKLAFPGWWMFFLLLAAPAILLGYALQVVIASTSFLSARYSILRAPNASRALTAAWLTSLGVVFAAVFFVDGGDTAYGSSFMYLTGLTSNETAAGISSTIATAAIVVWLGGWVWLFVEWILTLRVLRAQK